jgi:hypothetical protein
MADEVMGNAVLAKAPSAWQQLYGCSSMLQGQPVHLQRDINNGAQPAQVENHEHRLENPLEGMPFRMEKREREYGGDRATTFVSFGIRASPGQQ